MSNLQTSHDQQHHHDNATKKDEKMDDAGEKIEEVDNDSHDGSGSGSGSNVARRRRQEVPKDGRVSRGR